MILSHHSGDNVLGSRIAESVEQSLCKRGVPGSSPGLTAHFSLHVTLLKEHLYIANIQNTQYYISRTIQISVISNPFCVILDI